MGSSFSGAMSSLTAQASSFAIKPFRWIDEAKTEQQRRIRLAVVCSGMVLLGLTILTISLAMSGVIGPKAGPTGFNPGKFHLDFNTMPIFLIGTGLIGAGIGFAVNQSLRHTNPKQAKMINTALAVVGWTCFTAALGIFLFMTFKNGLVSAMTSSTQVIVAPIAAVVWLHVTYKLCKNWHPTESALSPKGAIYGKIRENSREKIEEFGRKDREARARRIDSGRKLDAALKQAAAAKNKE